MDDRYDLILDLNTTSHGSTGGPARLQVACRVEVTPTDAMTRLWLSTSVALRDQR
ncbi:hypothetical protein Plhal304r1_c059g0147661 [Plasmopara halstedii]